MPPVPPRKYQEDCNDCSILKDNIALLQDTHRKVTEIHITLFGVDSQGGHLKDYAIMKEKVENHDKKLYMAIGAFFVISFLLKLIHF